MTIDEQIAFHKEKIKELRASRVCSYCGAKGVTSKGLCANCYMRLRNNGTVVPKQRHRVVKDKKPDLNWENRLCADVVNFPFVAPADFKESVDFAIGLLIEKDREFLLERYKDKMTFEEVGALHGVTRERSRQIIMRAIRRLRHPSRIQYFVVGKKGVEERKLKQKEELERAKLEAQELKRTMGAALPIECLDLSVRAFNVVFRSGAETLGDVVELFGEDGDGFSERRGCGRKTVEEIREVVNKYREAQQSS